MAEEVERTFARTFLNMLSTQSITYSDDYRQPPELSLRKVPVLPVSLSLAPVPDPRTDYCSFTSILLRYPTYNSQDCRATAP